MDRYDEIARDLVSRHWGASNMAGLIAEAYRGMDCTRPSSSLPAPRGPLVCPECGHPVAEHNEYVTAAGGDYPFDWACVTKRDCRCTRTRSSLEQAGMGSPEDARSGDVSALNARQPVEAAQLAPQ